MISNQGKPKPESSFQTNKMEKHYTKRNYTKHFLYYLKRYIKLLLEKFFKEM